ncbi:hypothetical protein V8G54_037366 [Vigna mungo]|uniref:Uncharacterized protein n=1 Tax=Vigna mungo TaxID=3915 RepID=A0AAQ3MIQ5_VIGMU
MKWCSEKKSSSSLIGCEDRREKRILEAKKARWRAFLSKLAAMTIFSTLHQHFFLLSWGDKRKSLPDDVDEFIMWKRGLNYDAKLELVYDVALCNWISWLYEEVDDEQAHVLVCSSWYPSSSHFGFSSLQVWIANEGVKWIVVVRGCSTFGLRRNKPEWFALTRFWTTVKSVVVSCGDMMKDFLVDSLIAGLILTYGGATEEKICLQFAFYDLNVFACSMEALFFVIIDCVFLHILDNGDSYDGCVKRETHATHGGEVQELGISKKILT